jgi:hypothetical protein
MAHCKLRVLLVLLPLFLLMGCRKPARVTVDSGSTSERLTFVVTQYDDSTKALPSIDYFMVWALDCETKERQERVWMISPQEGEAVRPAPMRITYATPPPGYETAEGPAALGAGCYSAWVDGGAYAGGGEFSISADGSVGPED